MKIVIVVLATLLGIALSFRSAHGTRHHVQTFAAVETVQSHT